MKCWYCRTDCGESHQRIYYIWIGNSCWANFKFNKAEIDIHNYDTIKHNCCYYAWDDHIFEYLFITESNLL